MELEILLKPSTRPLPNIIVAQDTVQHVYLIRREEQKPRSDDSLLLYFPSINVKRIEPEGLQPSNRRLRGTFSSFPQCITNHELDKTCWAIPKYQGGIQFQMDINNTSYFINLDVNKGSVTKFECIKGLRGGRPGNNNLGVRTHKVR